MLGHYGFLCKHFLLNCNRLYAHYLYFLCRRKGFHPAIKRYLYLFQNVFCFRLQNPEPHLEFPFYIKKTRALLCSCFFGAEGETRTLAAVTHPTPLAGAPRHQLEYFCKLTGFTCQVVAPSRCFNNITK